jgi:hypothetical protein
MDNTDTSTATTPKLWNPNRFTKSSEVPTPFGRIYIYIYCVHTPEGKIKHRDNLNIVSIGATAKIGRP